jgi:hypothetical protein
MSEAIEIAEITPPQNWALHIMADTGPSQRMGSQVSENFTLASDRRLPECLLLADSCRSPAGSERQLLLVMRIIFFQIADLQVVQCNGPVATLRRRSYVPR